MKKRKLVIGSIFLALVMCASFVLPNFIRLNVNEPLAQRNVDMAQIGTLSYEEKVSEILETFDSYNISIDNNVVAFEADITLNISDITGFEFLSTNSSTVLKKYKTELDVEAEKFYIITEFWDEGALLETEKVETNPVYDEVADDYYITMPDGKIVSVAEALESESLNNCMVATATMASAAAVALLAATIVVAAPVVANVVTQVVTIVYSWVRSFFSWFRSLFTKKATTVVTTTVTTTITYPLTIAGTRVECKPYDDRMIQQNKYYLAVADTDDRTLYVSQKEISEAVALTILTTSTYIDSAHGTGKRFVFSIYTKSQTDALNLASQAGVLIGDPGVTHHIATRSGYFSHYHPGQHYSHPHAFYGLPR